MTEKDVANLITIARRAPLQNMAEAEAVAALLQKFAQHFAPVEPEQADGEGAG